MNEDQTTEEVTEDPTTPEAEGTVTEDGEVDATIVAE